MSKLKSLAEFKNQGLSLERKELLSVNGGADTSYYKNTTEKQGGDRIRCCKEDNEKLQTADNKDYKCVYI
jgi:hypothetical protein